MANQISLMEYLQTTPPDIPIRAPPNPGNNTTSRRYDASNIRNIDPWTQFTLANILNRYETLLRSTTLPAEPFQTSPLPDMTNGDTIKHEIASLLFRRIRHALRAGFDQLATTNSMQGLVRVGLGPGGFARFIDAYAPDTAYFVEALPGGQGPNRAPGDVKPSWKWNSSLRLSTNARDQREYRQVLSQVNYYMNQHKARHGAVITNRELVAIRRRDRNGNLEISNPIPWETQGNANQPQLTILLALWYLGMLAAQETGAQSWTLP